MLIILVGIILVGHLSEGNIITPIHVCDIKIYETLNKG